MVSCDCGVAILAFFFLKDGADALCHFKRLLISPLCFLTRAIWFFFSSDIPRHEIPFRHSPSPSLANPIQSVSHCALLHWLKSACSSCSYSVFGYSVCIQKGCGVGIDLFNTLTSLSFSVMENMSVDNAPSIFFPFLFFAVVFCRNIYFNVFYLITLI